MFRAANSNGYPAIVMLFGEKDSSIKFKGTTDRESRAWVISIMQSKISSFFKHPAALPTPSKSPDPPQVADDGEDDVLDLWMKKQHVIRQTYRRYNPNSNRYALIC